MGVLVEKVALVSGASAGIGRATAKLFALEGAKVIVAARRQDQLDTLLAEIRHRGGEGEALSGDVSDPHYAQALVNLAIDTYGRLDVAFNNAGVLGASGPTQDISLADWESTLKTNLTSAFLAAKYQLSAMLVDGGVSICKT